GTPHEYVVVLVANETIVVVPAESTAEEGEPVRAALTVARDSRRKIHHHSGGRESVVGEPFTLEAVAALHLVVASAADERVFAFVAEENVVARAADDQVVEVAAAGVLDALEGVDSGIGLAGQHPTVARRARLHGDRADGDRRRAEVDDHA